MNQINCVLGAIPPVAVGEIAFGRAELLDYDQALWLVAPKLEAISHHALQKARRNEIPYPPVFVEVHLCSDAQFERYAVESVLEPAMVANTVLRGKVYLSPTRAIGAVSAVSEMDVLTDRIGAIEGVARTTSSIVLSTKFER